MVLLTHASESIQTAEFYLLYSGSRVLQPPYSLECLSLFGHPDIWQKMLSDSRNLLNPFSSQVHKLEYSKDT